MVYPDLSFQSSDQKPVGLRVAPVTDRLLAFMLDFLIFSPVIGFFVSGLSRQMRTALLVDGQSPEGNVLWLMFLLAVMAIGILLETCFVYFTGGTPGQKFLKLEVRSYPGHARLDFVQVLTRTLLWWVFTPFVLPLVSVYTHPLRRTLHDRASDTMVVTLKRHGDPGPIDIERNFFLSWSRIFLIVLFIGAGLSLLRVQALLHDGHFLRLALEEKGALCAEIPAELSSGARLDRAVAYFLAGHVDQECLDHEADLVLWGKHASLQAFAYFAKGLASDDKEAGTAYLNKVCDLKKDSEFCAMTKFLASTSPDRADLLRTGGGGGVSSLTSQVLLLRESVARGKLAAAAALIKNLREEEGFEDYTTREEVRAMWKASAVSAGRAPASVEIENLRKEFMKRYELE